MPLNCKASATGIAALVIALALSAGVASADVTTDHSGSIVIFPKVIADGTRDTLIHISNARNSVVFAHCFYVNASLDDPTSEPGPDNPRRWQETDFVIRLTRQQPTIWRVSTGRVVNLDHSGVACGAVTGVSEQSCPGIAPGLVPTVALPGAPFEGQLECIEIMADGNPVGGNSLKGQAFIEGAGSNISSYNAFAIAGIDVRNDGVLDLDNVEYNACPARLVLNHLAQGQTDPALERFGVTPGDCTVETELTMIPCSQELEAQIPTSISVNVNVIDEFELALSIGGVRVDCWFNETLQQLQSQGLTAFDADVRDSTSLTTILRPSNGSGSGVLAVAENFRICGGNRAGADAQNLHAEGFHPGGDRISLTLQGICVDDVSGFPLDPEVQCLSQTDCPDNASCI